MEPVSEPLERAFTYGKVIPSFPALLGDPPLQGVCAGMSAHELWLLEENTTRVHANHN